MSLKETIEKASEIAGSQRNLAEQLGVSEQNLSGYKRGRPCGLRMRAKIAAIAGEDATRLLLEGMVEELDESVPHEAAAKAGIQAMLTAFPPETDEPREVVEKRWRKRSETNLLERRRTGLFDAVHSTLHNGLRHIKGLSEAAQGVITGSVQPHNLSLNFG